MKGTTAMKNRSQERLFEPGRNTCVPRETAHLMLITRSSCATKIELPVQMIVPSTADVRIVLGKIFLIYFFHYLCTRRNEKDWTGDEQSHI